MQASFDPTPMGAILALRAPPSWPAPPTSPRGSFSTSTPATCSPRTGSSWPEPSTTPSPEEDFDGVVVVHGTDTMSYGASALALMLGPLPKPVVLTGAAATPGRGSHRCASEPGRRCLRRHAARSRGGHRLSSARSARCPIDEARLLGPRGLRLAELPRAGRAGHRRRDCTPRPSAGAGGRALRPASRPTRAGRARLPRARSGAPPRAPCAWA